MIIWLCKYGETIPINENDRKYRVGMLGEALKNNNFRVIWWASDFDHGKKMKIEIPKTTYKGIQLKRLTGRPYKKNISIQRILHNREIGNEFSEKSLLEEKPDIIYTSMPTIDMAYRAAKYAEDNNVLLVVDIRDLWPDVFKTLIPFNVLRKDFWFKRMNQKLEYILNNADLVIAPTQEYLDWASRKKNLKLHDTLVVPFGYQRANDFNIYESYKVREQKFEVTFAGTVSVNFDLETVLQAAQKLENDDIYFNIIGSGDREAYLRNKYGYLSNVKFWGWCDATQLHNILKTSSIGIAPYLNHDNFIYNIPNKPYEYMAYGLSTFTCLKGATWNMLNKYQSGIYYEQGNAEDLAEKLLIFKNSTNRIEASNNILRVFEREFAADIVYNNLVKKMEGLAKKK